jgi:hypothetical protein
MYAEDHPFNKVAALVSETRENARKAAVEGRISADTYQRINKSANLSENSLGHASNWHQIKHAAPAAGKLHEAINHLTDAAGILFKEAPDDVYLSPGVVDAIDPHVTGAHIGNYLAEVSPIRTGE